MNVKFLSSPEIEIREDGVQSEMVAVEEVEGHTSVLSIEVREGGSVDGGVTARVHPTNVQFTQAKEERVVGDTPLTNAPCTVSSHLSISTRDIWHLRHIE